MHLDLSMYRKRYTVLIEGTTVERAGTDAIVGAHCRHRVVFLEGTDSAKTAQGDPIGQRRRQ